jgi:outer membrane protein TolC
MKSWFCIFLLISSLRSIAQEKNLDYYIKEALQSSPLLKDYQFQVQGNKIDSQRLRASFGPQVNSNTNAAYAPVIRGWGYDAVITNLRNFNALMVLSQPLIGKENLGNQYMSIQLLNQGLQNQTRLSAADLERTITQQYLTAYGSLLQINFNQEVLNLLREEQIILKQLAEKGVYRQTDFLSFLVAIQQEELLIRQLRIQYQNDFGTLNYMAGLQDTAYVQIDSPNLKLVVLPDLNETIYYQKFTIDSLKIITDDKQIDFNYRPKLSLYADAGYISSFAITPYKNFGFSAGAALTVPIYDGRQRKMLHQKNFIADQSRLTYRDFFSTQYYQQVKQLKQQLSLSEQLIESAQLQVKYAEGLIKAQHKQLVTGDTRIADYIIAIGNYLNAQNIITQNMVNQLQIINQINYWNRKS